MKALLDLRTIKQQARFLPCTRDIVAIQQTIVRARRYANDCFIIFVLVYLRRLSYSLFNFLAKEL